MSREEYCEACGAEPAAWELGADPAAYISKLADERDRYKAEMERLTAENDELSQKVCDECDGDGWVQNRVEGRGACTCMIEAEPFQILLKALEQVAAGKEDSFYTVEKIAKEALRAVLPLDYPK